MGLIKALTGSAFSYIGDMWEDYIYSDTLSNDILVKKGHAKRSGGAGSNADDNIITKFSKIAVNAGQTLIVVEDGKIVDFTAEQGGYEYNFDTEPSAFCGDFGDALKVSFEQMKERFAYGGRAGKDQRAYYINTKEIVSNKFGFGNVPYRDSEFDLTITLQGYGTYSFWVANPLVFFHNISGNVSEEYKKAVIEPQIRAELQDALLPALGSLAKEGIRYDELPSNTERLKDVLRERTFSQWKEKRGIEIANISLSNIFPDDESIDKIRDLQESRVYSGNKLMLGARVGAAQANAMETAAGNATGAVTGFMGMNMAAYAGGVNVNELMNDTDDQTTGIKAIEHQEIKAVSGTSRKWICPGCSMENYMGFCPKCGMRRPEKRHCMVCGFELPKEYEEFSFCPKCGGRI